MKANSTPNPLETNINEPFILTSSALDYFLERPHRMPNGAIILCLNGYAEITLNMKKCTMNAHSRIVIIPHSILMVKEKSDNFQALCFAYSNQIFDEACFRLEPDFIGYIKENFHYRFPPDVFEKNMYYINLVHSLYEDRGNRFRLKMTTNILQNFFLDTFDKVYRHQDRQTIKESDRTNEVYKNFIQLVHKYFKEVREVSFYANELSISTRYLNTITKRTDNITPKTFIDNAIVQEIKLMLHTPDMSMQQIARELNFPDQSYLTRFFKNRTGMTPGEYRKGRNH